MKEKKKKYHLTTAADPLLGELRDVNFAAIGKRLNQVARRLDDDYKVRTRVIFPRGIECQLYTAQAPSKDRRAATRLRWEAWWSAD